MGVDVRCGTEQSEAELGPEDDFIHDSITIVIRHQLNHLIGRTAQPN